MDRQYDIIGFGIAFYDMILSVPAAELQRLNLQPGASKQLPQTTCDALVAQYGATGMCGGPVANTLTGMAALGMKAAQVGAVGADAAGLATQENLRARGIDQFYQVRPETVTPVIYVLVTPDGERSFIYFINSGEDIRRSDIPKNITTLSRMFYSQLKFIGRGGLIPLFRDVFTAAREAGTDVVYGLQSFNRASSFASELRKLARDTATIIIGNDEEMTEFLADGQAYPDKLLVRTRGKEGVEIISAGSSTHIEVPTKIENVVDTIGAGDQFTAGFIYGLQRNLPYEKCALIGFRTAAEILQQRGGQPQIGKNWAHLTL